VQDKSNFADRAAVRDVYRIRSKYYDNEGNITHLFNNNTQMKVSW
jgi:hypothetical protein